MPSAPAVLPVPAGYEPPTPPVAVPVSPPLPDGRCAQPAAPVSAAALATARTENNTNVAGRPRDARPLERLDIDIGPIYQARRRRRQGAGAATGPEPRRPSGRG